MLRHNNNLLIEVRQGEGFTEITQNLGLPGKEISGITLRLFGLNTCIGMIVRNKLTGKCYAAHLDNSESDKLLEQFILSLGSDINILVIVGMVHMGGLYHRILHMIKEFGLFDRLTVTGMLRSLTSTMAYAFTYDMIMSGQWFSPMPINPPKNEWEHAREEFVESLLNLLPKMVSKYSYWYAL